MEASNRPRFDDPESRFDNTMSGDTYISVGPRIPLFNSVAALPYPTSSTDASGGADVAALVSGRVQTGPVRVVLYLEADADVIIQNVRVHVFELVEPDPGGKWAALAVPGAGELLYQSLALRANWPNKTKLTDIGAATRLAVTADFVGANLSGWLQLLERM